MKCEIKYYRRYRIIVGNDYACVICKQNKGKCIPFTDLKNAETGVDLLLDGWDEKTYNIDNTKSWRR